MVMGVGTGLAGADRSSDEARFAQLHVRFHQLIREFCSGRVAFDTVDDAVADTFLTVWRRLDEVPAGKRRWCGCTGSPTG
jgi:DNA-directed RNA polymerase specialized sigma24 family protein